MNRSESAPPVQQVPSGIVAIADYEEYARDHMGPGAWAYFSGGAADELTLRDNVHAFQRLRLCTRLLAGMADGHTEVSLFGHTYDYPVMLGPVAFQKLAHPQGELAAAAAASAMRAGMVVSTQSSYTLEDISRNSQSPLWFQLYVQTDSGHTRELVQRAETSGYRAVVLTADAPVNGPRNREQRAMFQLPEGVESVNLRGMKTSQAVIARAGTSPVFQSGILTGAAAWKDIPWVRSLTRLPVLLKGVMTPADALKAIDHGVDGIIVSNHGGRVLDTLPATIDVLPGITKAVAGRVPLLLDGGIRRGTDILKALALGANAVLIGRPYIYGLAAAGVTGVSHVLHILRTEFETAMVLTGCRTLRDITPDIIWNQGEE
jgi:4-hydroxymandelate oxidase